MLRLLEVRGGEQIGKGKSGRTPNDQRSDALNPTSEEFQAAQDNRSVQLNVENDVEDDVDEEEKK